ncbi:uncharacterized protein LOC125943746 [Dermacentor silvarum]|uniref:uncharacterized protein LOC125943746 n=1 Tax=Dermacentor silvarum TaxID=543639 RepID=UPI0021015508|nr:uncharacterized protein LOC125943746 [Dermacentor silvarum]
MKAASMDFIKPPEPLRLEGDISKHWELFKQRFQLFLTATEPASKKREASTKTALLLSVAGEEAIEVYNTFSFTEDESKDDYDAVIKKFDEYFASQVNEVHQRYLFRSRMQEPGLLPWSVAGRQQRSSKAADYEHCCLTSNVDQPTRSSSIVSLIPLRSH